ncbi:hypothetical protein [Micromonospora sp. NPDC047187]
MAAPQHGRLHDQRLIRAAHLTGSASATLVDAGRTAKATVADISARLAG